MPRIFKLFPSLLLLFSSALNAQEMDIQIDPVTVTSSLQSLSISKTGRNIVYIQGKEFANLPIHSIDDLLRYVPGLEVQSRGPMGTQSDFVLRGSTFQQVLIIIDGIRVNEPLTGHMNSYIPISPEEIDHIEVLKGASSAIYGSDAVGGVINIITKTFAAKDGKPQEQMSAQVTGGQYNLFNAQVGGFYSDGKTSIAGGILSNNSKGQPLRGTDGYFNNNTASISFSHRFDDNWQMAYRSSIDNRSFSAQNFYTFSPLDTATEKVQSFWNQLQVGYKKGKNNLILNAGYKNIEDEYYFFPSFVPNLNRTKMYQALTVYNHQFNDKVSLSSGLQYQNRQILSNDRGNHVVNQAAGFIILQQEIVKNLNISPALRLDWHELSGTELVPQLNVSYSMHNIQLRGSSGRTLRYADFTEQYNNYNKPPIISAGQRIGNPDLKAETSWNYEAGADWFYKSLKLSATYFHRDYYNMIDYILTNYQEMPRQINLQPGANYLLADNVVNSTSNGLEIDLQYIKALNKKQHLNINSGFVWINSVNNQTSPSLYLLSYAKILANFSVKYSTPRFSMGITGLYKIRDPQSTILIPNSVQFALSKDYFLLNGKVEYFILPKKKLGVFLEIDNVLDKHYSDVLGSIMPGRWLMGGLNLSLFKK